MKQRADVISGGSYLSSNDMRPHFGLGQASKIDDIEIHWPDGKVEHVTVPGKSERPLMIHIAEVRREAVIEIRDATPRPAPNLPDEAARWKSVGLTPNGRLGQVVSAIAWQATRYRAARLAKAAA